ncbi:MAG: LysM domain-containing protein, partial [Peptostreptococcaceae bacterium]
VPKNTVEQMPEKFITNDEVESKLIGKQLRGGLVKGEFISEDRVIDKEDENFIEVKLILDGNSTPVNQNDFVNIYVVGNVRGEVSIQRVFEQKRVNKKTTVEENEGQRVTYISLDLTEKEAMTYLKAKELGKIVAVKNNNLDKKEETKDVESFKEADIIIFDENKTELTEIKETVGMITTIFKEGDTLEDLAIKHKTNVATIIELNEGKQYFEINENIVLPSI